MFQREKTEALFQLLKEMTLYTRKNGVTHYSRQMQRMQQIEKWLMIGFIAIMIVEIVVAAVYRFVWGKPAHGVPQPVSAILLAGIVLAMLYMLTVIIEVLSTAWQQRHERFVSILAPLKEDMPNDVAFLIRLNAFDTSILAYGLTQYRHLSGISVGRLGLLAGDVQKIGLFPALTAAVVSAAALRHGEISNPFLWSPLILACCFYLAGFVLLGGRERASQVVALLEYVIAQRDKAPDEAYVDASRSVSCEDDIGPQSDG